MQEAKTPFTPEEAGYVESRIKVLDDFFQEQMDKGVIRTATYCMAKDGKIFANKAIGDLSYEVSDLRPLLPDTLQSIASVTKFFTAAAIFTLVEDGKIRLSQPVSDFIEEFKKPPFDKIGLTHLLTHTSGLGVDGGALPDNGKPDVYDFISEEFEKGNKNWIAAALKTELRFEPGEQWAYASFGFTLLGEIIQRVSGKKLTEYITERILIPCEMSNTCYQMSKEQLEKMIINKESMLRWKTEQLEQKNQGEDTNPWKLLPPGGGGLKSTAEDLVKFGIMLDQGGFYNGKRVMSRKAIEKMIRTYTAENVKDYCWGQPGTYRPYGLGPDKRCNDEFIYSPGTYGHEGAGRCNLLIDPVEHFVVSYFTPYIHEEVWDAVPVWNSLSIMWSGIK